MTANGRDGGHLDVPAARNTLRILSHLAAQRGPVAAVSIAATLELPRSTVYRLLGVLEDAGFVLHYPEAKRYGIGIAAFEISSGYARQEPLTRLGAPVLATLADRLGESAHLAVLHGREVLYLIEERAPRRPALVTDVGVRLPSHLTASGRAMLAALPAAQLRALFPGASAFADRGLAASGPALGDTDAPITGYGQLKRTLEGVRQRGYASEDGAITADIASIAVAVLDHAGWPAAAIAVTFDRGRIPPERWPALAADIRADAAELTRRIRGAVPPGVASL